MDPREMFYTKDHEWITRPDGDGVCRVGLTDYAQEKLGDIVFVEFPDKGSYFEAGFACACVESVKAASDIYAPVAGRIAGLNELLDEAPETINQSAFDAGWILEIKIAEESQLNELMDYAAYTKFIEN